MTFDVDSVFLNGTVGSGKTTVASALSAIETVPHAVIDLDAIRQLRPSPEGDPFNRELELVNLRSLASNFRRAGAQRFILAGVIEDANDVERYAQALESRRMTVVRLTASPLVLHARLVARHADDREALSWHTDRVGKLSQILDDSSIDQSQFDTSTHSPAQSAAAIRTWAGWQR